jgi:FtsP/CotA-like multicopper oxidase with cupredoxin domain
VLLTNHRLHAGHNNIVFAVLSAVLLLLVSTAVPVAQSSLASISVNDNARSAGTISGGVAVVRLEAARGGWKPEGQESPELEVAAFGEEGRFLQIPGPMIRVRANSEIVVAIRNRPAETLFVHGLVGHPVHSDAVLAVPAGEIREARFIAGAPGTYHYWATTGRDTPIGLRKSFDTQLGGAFIVDSPGGSSADRVFVITEWNSRDGQTPAPARRLCANNGQSWPFTERLEARIGQRAHWRWINLTTTSHPMHLHGFYFRVTGSGTGLVYTTLATDAVREVVTENIPTSGTMEMTWVPDRPGQWLLHCHTLAHISPNQRFWSINPAGDHHRETAHDPSVAMAGLVLGITVNGDARAESRSPLPVRRLTLAMYQRPNFWSTNDAYAFALSEGDTVPSADAVTVPGPPIILTRGQPVDITIRNAMPTATSVHWHGIELDSYYDGVPGFSGSSGSITPLIGAGDSFRVRFTPPRAGTFIYHTHSHDDVQLASGLYGALIVLEPGETFDPAVDHLLVFGMIGRFDPKAPNRMPVVVNGKATELNLPEGPRPQLRFKAGVANRLRLINITTIAELSVSLMNRTGPLEWQPVGKDGASLPPSERQLRPASRHVVAVGETYDFVVTPRSGGPIWLELRYAPSGMWVQQILMAVDGVSTP